jgi:hypothetical protein
MVKSDGIHLASAYDFSRSPKFRQYRDGHRQVIGSSFGPDKKTYCFLAFD